MSVIGTPRDQANEVATLRTSCPLGNEVGSAMEISRANKADIAGADSGFIDLGFKKSAGPW